MTDVRRSGVLLHITSLPGRYGIGTLNQDAYDWVNFLAETRQTLWQVLPLGPTSYGDSPYQSFSTFAGNPYLISLEALVEMGLLDQWELDNAPAMPRDRVDFGTIYNWKMPLLGRVAVQFDQRVSPPLREEFGAFVADNADWLEDFALFMALKDVHNGASWIEWDMPLRSRQPDAIAAARQTHAGAIHNHRLNQWLFYRQWLALKQYANERGVLVVGDIPIFVAPDSADAWAHPDLFYMDDQGQLTVVAGVPPDYFSATGQLWGNPLYRWDVMDRTGYAWWIARFRAMLTLVDIIRVDHFRAFYNYWEIPAGQPTAIHGRWVLGPGPGLFEAVQQSLGDVPIVAEDLGYFEPEAKAGMEAIMQRFDLPGMKVLQFAFLSDPSDLFLPHNWKTPDLVVYPGTHDNDTTVGWWENSSTPAERAYVLRYVGKPDGSDIAWDLLRVAWASIAKLALVSAQDLLSLGTWARMNLPGRPGGNWQWRYLPGALDQRVQARLLELTTVFGRQPMLAQSQKDDDKRA